MNQEFGFAAPAMLYGFFPLLLLLLYLVRAEREMKRRLAALGSNAAAQGPRKQRVVLPAVLMATLILGAARPHLGYREVEIPLTGRDTVALVDVSKSMLARDFKPNRLEFNKRKLLDLVALLRARRLGERLGLVLFAGDSYVYCPLTVDYAVLEHFIRSIATELVMAPGSAIDAAIASGVEVLNDSLGRDGRLLLVSDGEDLRLAAEQAVTALGKTGYTLDVLGVGGTEGAPIEIGQGQYLRDHGSNVVMTKLREEPLRQLAAAGGGRYARATLNDSDLQNLIGTTADLPRSAIGTIQGEESISPTLKTRVRKITVYDELGVYFFWLAFAILALAADVRRREWLLAALLTLSASATDLAQADAASADKAPSSGSRSSAVAKITPVASAGLLSLYQAQRAYDEGRFAEAHAAFDAHLKNSPDDVKAKQALGNTLYRLGEFAAAAQLFDAVAKSPAKPYLRFQAYYNAGNARYMGRQFAEAVKSYDQALIIKPEDPPTVANRELALRQLEQQQEQSKNPAENESTDEQQSQGDGQAQNQSSADPEASNSQSPAQSKSDESQSTPSQSTQSAPSQPPQSPSAAQSARQQNPQTTVGADDRERTQTPPTDPEPESVQDEDREIETTAEASAPQPSDSQTEPQSPLEAKKSPSSGPTEEDPSANPPPSENQRATAEPPAPKDERMQPSSKTSDDTSSATPPEQTSTADAESAGGTTADPSTAAQGQALQTTIPADSGVLRKDPSRAPATPQYDAKKLKEDEAREWLDSLSDAPILLRRKRGRGSAGGQTW